MLHLHLRCIMKTEHVVNNSDSDEQTILTTLTLVQQEQGTPNSVRILQFSECGQLAFHFRFHQSILTFLEQSAVVRMSIQFFIPHLDWSCYALA